MKLVPTPLLYIQVVYDSVWICQTSGDLFHFAVSSLAAPVPYCVLALFFSQPLGGLVFTVKSDLMVTMAVCISSCVVSFAIKHKFSCTTQTHVTNLTITSILSAYIYVLRG